ncbi:MAG: GDSL-type esterase/lipase family protein [Treponema sp.]|nr:GDSL-type esterase/lipase family protein [Treponema sp.]
MKKIIYYAAGILVFLCLNGCKNEPAAPPPPSLVCLGDSLTAGFGAAAPGREDRTKSYPAYLQKKVNLPVINAGQSGDTTSNARSRIRTGVLAKNPRIVVIELGANDFLLANDPPAATQNNLQEIIRAIDNGERKIYLAKFYTKEVVESMPGLGDPAALMSQYDAMFEYLASLSSNIELIEDIWSGVWGIYMSDSVHPNAKGYEIMADNYYRAMEPYLREHGFIQ